MVSIGFSKLAGAECAITWLVKTSISLGGADHPLSWDTCFNTGDTSNPAWVLRFQVKLVGKVKLIEEMLYLLVCLG